MCLAFQHIDGSKGEEGVKDACFQPANSFGPICFRFLAFSGNWTKEQAALTFEVDTPPESGTETGNISRTPVHCD